MIDAGSGTVTVAGGSTLSRTSATGVLTVNAASISGPSTGQIILDIQGNGGEFLSASVAPSNLTAASFNVDNYRQGTEVKSTASGFELILGGGALPFEWKGTDGSGNGKWKLGTGSDRNNWDNQEYDFATGDIANFKGHGQGDVTLVGLVNPGKLNITAGTYNFKGEDANAYLSTPELNVTGTNTKLTISNTKANNVDVTNIGSGGEINISRGDALGSGTVNNNGKLNVTLAADGELANVLAGTGTVEKTGAGKLTLTGNSTAAGGTINVTDGSLEVGNGTSGSYNGNIVSASDVTFNNDNDTIYAGSFSNGGKLVKEGTGALTLSGSAASGVEINAGSIIVGNANALGTGADIKTGGTLNVNGISVTSAIDLNGGSLVNNNSATAATVNNVALSADSKIGGNGDLTISAQLTGNFNLEKTGTGTTTLTEDNNAIGATTVSGGKLQLAGTVGNAGNAVVLGNGTALVVNRNGDVAGDISGAGSVDILKNASLTGTALSYTGATNVTGATLTGNISSQSDLLLTNTATYNLGGADRTIKSANIKNGSKIDLNGQDLTVTGTLDVIATQSQSDAPIQGNNGKLVLASGSTFNANLENDKTAYSLSAGGTTPVYFADGLSGYTDSGATVNTTGNRLFRVEGGLNYSNNSLFVNIKRNFAADLFPNISPQLAPVIDNYAGSNDWIEYMMTNEDDDSVTEKYVQGGLDLVNLSNAMSVLYDTQTGIDNILYSRSRHFVTRSTRSNYLTLGQCDPCDAVSCDSLYCGSGSDREFYVAPIYGNHRGYNLSSGGFNYGYVNDQWAMGFGVDQSYGRTRVGLLGVYGEGKALTRGTLPKTINETSFGGLFLYANTHRGDLDLLLTAGYLGMENSVEQFTSGDSLSGNITNGLAAFSAILTQTLRYGDLYVLPSFGIEYGYYHQGSLSAKYGDDKVVVTRGDKSHANLAVIPVGVRLTREGVAFGGRLNPEFRARYIANVGGVSADYNTWLIGSPNNSALMSTRMTDRHAGDIGLGFGWTRQAVSLRGDVGYLFAEHYGDLTVSGSATWKF
ncbi:MAG: autotransporter-associated beta strand repeat-containing protein [Planctomycetaceae bacterium]|nr:autotransporter-associated beta strand repeat-containing protein [Planctomycetaceae bacterium]